DCGSAAQRRRPGGLVIPVERRLRCTRSDPYRQSAGGQPLGHTAAGLAGATEHQDRGLVYSVFSNHVFLLLIGINDPLWILSRGVDWPEPTVIYACDFQVVCIG